MAKPILLVRANTQDLNKDNLDALKASILDLGIEDQYFVLFTSCNAPYTGFALEVSGVPEINYDLKSSIGGKDLLIKLNRPNNPNRGN